MGHKQRRAVGRLYLVVLNRARAPLTERGVVRYCKCRGLVLRAPVPERLLAAARRRVTLLGSVSAAGGLVEIAAALAAKCVSVRGEAMRTQRLTVAERAVTVRAHEKRARVQPVTVSSKLQKVCEGTGAVWAAVRVPCARPRRLGRPAGAALEPGARGPPHGRVDRNSAMKLNQIPKFHGVNPLVFIFVFFCGQKRKMLRNLWPWGADLFVS